ncbi:hypothetical protein WAI453_001759 [Rhynchosporium graminicola]
MVYHQPSVYSCPRSSSLARPDDREACSIVGRATRRTLHQADLISHDTSTYERPQANALGSQSFNSAGFFDDAAPISHTTDLIQLIESHHRSTSLSNRFSAISEPRQLSKPTPRMGSNRLRKIFQLAGLLGNRTLPTKEKTRRLNDERRRSSGGRHLLQTGLLLVTIGTFTPPKSLTTVRSWTTKTTGFGASTNLSKLTAQAQLTHAGSESHVAKKFCALGERKFSMPTQYSIQYSTTPKLRIQLLVIDNPRPRSLGLHSTSMRSLSPQDPRIYKPLRKIVHKAT